METSSDNTQDSSQSQQQATATHPMLRRPLDTNDVEEVLEFAAERLAILEALHPRSSDEAPGKYIDRIATLTAAEDEVLLARGFIEGMAAALALDIDDLFQPNSGHSGGEGTASTPV
jgi:hypothetical protein